MTAARAQSKDQRIADLFRDGYTLNYVAEAGLRHGWTRADAEAVGEQLGGLSHSGRLVPKLARPYAAPTGKPIRLKQAHHTRHADFRIPRGAQPREVAFTPTQLRVLEHLLTDGADDQAIASRMGRSLDTVKSHVKAMYKRAGVSNRCALAIGVLKGEIVPVTGNGRRV